MLFLLKKRWWQSISREVATVNMFEAVYLVGSCLCYFEREDGTIRSRKERSRERQGRFLFLCCR
jgi:hypothetical protein